MRKFKSGAKRSRDDLKIDYEGCMSPLVLEAFGRYMRSHNRCEDGSLRGGDNWQKGMPSAAYMKSAWRHFMDVWAIHRGYSVWSRHGTKGEEKVILPKSPPPDIADSMVEQGWKPVPLRDAVCALLFNVQGFLHETIKAGH